MRRLHEAVLPGIAPGSSDHPTLYDQAARMIRSPGMQAFDLGGGVVVGATDAGGETIKDRPVSEKDLFQTVYRALGIDAHSAHMTPVGRPIKLVDGGHPVDELLL